MLIALAGRGRCGRRSILLVLLGLGQTDGGQDQGESEVGFAPVANLSLNMIAARSAGERIPQAATTSERSEFFSIAPDSAPPWGPIVVLLGKDDSGSSPSSPTETFCKKGSSS